MCLFFHLDEMELLCSLQKVAYAYEQGHMFNIGVICKNGNSHQENFPHFSSAAFIGDKSFSSFLLSNVQQIALWQHQDWV